MVTPNVNVMPGLYRHWKGGYYVVLNVSRGTGKDNEDTVYVNYQNVLHPEFGVFTRPFTEFFEEVHDEKYYQTQRFVHVEHIDGEDRISDVSTEDLIRELQKRTDSPIHDLDIKGLESNIFCRDYVVGYKAFPTLLQNGRMTDKGVSDAVPFQTKEDAKRFMKNGNSNNRLRLFRRVFIEEE